MPTLLQIDSSPLGPASVSRHLTHHFAEEWKKLRPGGTIIVRDLTTTSIPPLTGAWVAANHTPEASRTPEQNSLLALSDSLIAELQSAEEFVFGVPMHNFSIPSTLKLWLDQIIRAGKTFSYVDGRPQGLLTNKKATFLIASGGDYGPGTAMASFNFVEPYLRTVFGFLGVTDTKFVTAGGSIALNYGRVDRETFFQPHIESIQQYLQSATI